MKKKTNLITLLENLYILTKVYDTYDEGLNIYTYRIGTKLSSVDSLRIGIAKLQSNSIEDLASKVTAKRGANNKIDDLKSTYANSKGDLTKSPLKREVAQLINRDSELPTEPLIDVDTRLTYRMIKGIMYIYKPSDNARLFLGKHINLLQEYYGDKLKVLNNISEEEKAILMPEFYKLIGKY